MFLKTFIVLIIAVGLSQQSPSYDYNGIYGDRLSELHSFIHPDHDHGHWDSFANGNDDTDYTFSGTEIVGSNVGEQYKSIDLNDLSSHNEAHIETESDGTTYRPTETTERYTTSSTTWAN